jgi:hypothetical protein
MVHALNHSPNLTDSGRGKYNYFLLTINSECLHSISSIDFVFCKMFYYYIPANLVNKTETNKTNLIRTTIIDTYSLKRLATIYGLHTNKSNLSLLSYTS